MFPRKPGEGFLESGGRPSGRPGRLEVRLGVVEDGNLEKVQVLEGEGVDHAASGVEGPVRDVLVSGGGVGVVGVLLR